MMRKILALLLILALVASLVMSSNLVLAQEGGDGGGEGGTAEGEGGETGGTGTPADEPSQHLGSPADEDKDLPQEQVSPPPEGTFILSDEVKAGIAVGIIGALVVAFVIWTKRG